MSEAFIAEIRIFPFNFAPRGWALCNGQLLPISQNTALFSLVGTNFGGDGRSTFALPNLRGSAPIQPGQGPGLSNYNIGETGGQSTVTLLQSQIPSHTHAVNASNANGNQVGPAGNSFAKPAAARGLKMYGPTANDTMNPGATSVVGGDQPHENMMPFLVVNYCIALQGIYPARN